METQDEEISDEELAKRIHFYALRKYGGERELMELAERRIRKKSEKNVRNDGNAGCLVELLAVVIILRILGCV